MNQYVRSWYLSYIRKILRPSKGFSGNREKGIYSEEQGNKGQILRGTGEQRQYLGTGNIRKQIFDFWGTGEQANLFRGTREQVPPWEGLHLGTYRTRSKTCVKLQLIKRPQIGFQDQLLLNAGQKYCSIL